MMKGLHLFQASSDQVIAFTLGVTVMAPRCISIGSRTVRLRYRASKEV